MSELVERLRNSAIENQQDTCDECVSYARILFEAADEIERLTKAIETLEAEHEAEIEETKSIYSYCGTCNG